MIHTIAMRLVLAIAVFIPCAYATIRSIQQSSKENITLQDNSLPEKIGNWTSEPVELTQVEREVLGCPSACQRLYVDSQGDEVQVLLVQVARTQNAHDPKLCMAGSGFRMVDDRTMPSPWARRDSHELVHQSAFERGSYKVQMLYWFQMADRMIPDMSLQYKLASLVSALKGEKFDGIAVRLMALPNAITRTSPNQTPSIELWQMICQSSNLEHLIQRSSK